MEKTDEQIHFMLRPFLIVSLASALVFSYSCKKEETPPPAPPEEPAIPYGKVSATIEGEAWESDSLQNLVVIENGDMRLLCQDDVHNLRIFVDSMYSAGVYDFNSIPGNLSLYSNTELSQTFVDTDNGTINIMALDALTHRMDGNFSLLLINQLNPTSTVTIEDGNFTNLPVWYIQSIETENFTFNVDGNPYEPDNVEVNVVPFDKTLRIEYSETVGIGNGSLKFPYDIEPGEYQYSEDDLGPIYFWYNFMRPDIGTLVITVNDVENRHVEGIFDVNVENLITLETAVISSGSFTIDY